MEKDNQLWERLQLRFLQSCISRAIPTKAGCLQVGQWSSGADSLAVFSKGNNTEAQKQANDLFLKVMIYVLKEWF